MTGPTGTNVAVCAQALIDSVICPEHASARLVLTHASGDEFDQFTAMPEGFELVIFEVGENVSVAGKRVKNIALPVGSRLIADTTRSAVVTDETRIEPGTRYLLALDLGVVAEVRRLFVAWDPPPASNGSATPDE
ncbi:MAG: hypothetical protein ABEJ73_11275 [Haloplanus sp.]